VERKAAGLKPRERHFRSAGKNKEFSLFFLKNDQKTQIAFTIIAAQ